jgi:hypothetical protein
MNTSALIEFMQNCSDPLEHTVEQTFKNNNPNQDEDPEIAFRYWQMYIDIYGTPSNHMAVRSMFYNFKALHDSDNKEMARLMEIITTLRAERDEARRMYCGRVSRDVPLDAFDIAKNHGWDCFKEDGK